MSELSGGEDWGGPYVQCALLCDQVIEGKDSALTIIRVIDRYVGSIIVPGGSDVELPPIPPFRGVLVISLRAGQAKGSYPLSIRIQRPSGLYLESPIETTVFFEGEERGINLVAPMELQFEVEGLYWFDIRLDQRMITRVPLRVLVQKQTMPAPLA